jgi:bifunctional DNA-binding transcriptional regulator/antitoxin component of YhaV-PrlF toxin-antitoxin module
MNTLTVTSRGQVTFRKDVLRHLGIKPGEKIEIELLPDGVGRLKAARPSGGIDGFIGLLAGRTRMKVSLDEITEAAAHGWAGRR